MTMTDAIELFHEKAEQGEVANSRTGTFGPISAGMRDVILTSVRHAARRAGGTSDPSRIPYAAVSQMLPEHARQDSIEHGRGDGANEAARVRRFLLTVEGNMPKRRRTREWSFLPAWRPLAEALSRWERRQSGRRNLKSKLHALMELASTNGGLTRPEDLPDRNRIQMWAEEADVPRATYLKMISAYRAARAELEREDPEHSLPDIDQAPLVNERGIRSLPLISRVARDIGHEGPIKTLDTMAVLEQIAPIMHGALSAYIQEHRSSDGSAAWEKGVKGAVSRVVASAIRTGSVRAKNLLPADLFLERVTLEDEDEPAEYERLALERYGEEVEAGGTREVPLLQHLCEEMAALSAANSPTRLKGSAARSVGEGEVPYYTKAIQADVTRLASLARFTLERAKSRLPERYAAISVTERAILEHMTELNRKRGMNGRLLDKNIGLDLISYPLVVCLGLPALAREVRRLEAAYFEAFERCGHDHEHRAVAEAAQRFDALLTSYIATAFYFADGLREKNYTYARIGAPGVTAAMVDEHGRQTDDTLTHVWPERDAETGEVVRLQTHFSGDDHRLPRLKVRFEEDGETPRRRTWQIRPGILDFHLFTEFLLGTRVRHLVQQGKLVRFDDYSLERDMHEWNYALFVSPRASDHHYRRLVGGYSDQQLAPWVAESLHWMAKHVFGHADLPELGSPEWHARYPRAITGHKSRSDIASYWLSIRGRSDLACRYTNDTEATLRRKYARVTTEQLDAEFLGQPAWRRPDFFDDAIDQIWFRGEVIDWESQSPVLALPRQERPPGLA